MATVNEKKHLRRRSNWYIYLISFAATTVLLGLLILALYDVIFPGSSIRETDLWGDFVPSDEYNTTVLFMMSDTQGGTPDNYMLMSYRPREEIIELVPLNPATRVTSGNTTGKLTDLHNQGGAKKVMLGIKETLNVECDFFVTLNRPAFVGFMSLFGEIRINVPFFFEGGGIDLHTGEHFLAGNDLYLYMNYADFPLAGEDYNLVIMGSAISTLINSNARYIERDIIQAAFNKILDTTTTDLTFRNFTYYQPALAYTAENSVNPATYYVPSGRYEGDVFVISEQSVSNIHTRFNISP